MLDLQVMPLSLPELRLLMQLPLQLQFQQLYRLLI
jgi:hypothetical protein